MDSSRAFIIGFGGCPAISIVSMAASHVERDGSFELLGVAAGIYDILVVAPGAKCTSLLCSVRPVSTVGSFLLGPSTITSSVPL